MYTPEEKSRIDEWLRKIGAQNLGIDYDYEYRPYQLLQATNSMDSIYDYDRWQNLQKLCGMEIPLALGQKLEEIFYLNDIESLELKGE